MQDADPPEKIRKTEKDERKEGWIWATAPRGLLSESEMREWVDDGA